MRACSSRLAGLGRLMPLARGHQHAATPGMMEVCVIDPLLVLEPERLHSSEAGSSCGGSGGGGSDAAGIADYVSLLVPFRLLAQLHQGHLELADRDDPGNHWYFGQRGELFQYKFVGRHRVQSGFTSLVLAHELQALRAHQPQRANRKQAALDEHSWLAFLQHVRGSSGEGLWPTPSLPFLFAGKAIDCESVGVYALDSGGSVQGLALSSEYETPGAA